LVVVEDPAEDELDCCWYANAGADAARRTAATARHFMVRFMEICSPAYYRAIQSRHKARRTSERVSDNERTGQRRAENSSFGPQDPKMPVNRENRKRAGETPFDCAQDTPALRKRETKIIGGRMVRSGGCGSGHSPPRRVPLRPDAVVIYGEHYCAAGTAPARKRVNTRPLFPCGGCATLNRTSWPGLSFAIWLR
jgi:hypothetical protein